jgi:hypothetical protein
VRTQRGNRGVQGAFAEGIVKQITGPGRLRATGASRTAARRRPLLVFEPYEPRCSTFLIIRIPMRESSRVVWSVGFELLKPDAWSFPRVREHQVAIDKETDDFAVTDDYAEELFAYPLSSVPEAWLEHLQRW